MDVVLMRQLCRKYERGFTTQMCEIPCSHHHVAVW